MAYSWTPFLFTIVVFTAVAGVMYLETAVSSLRPFSVKPAIDLSMKRSLGFYYHSSSTTSDIYANHTSEKEATPPISEPGTINKYSIFHQRDFKQNPVNVAFFEGFRREWLYRHVFKPSKSKVACNCSTAFSATKKLISQPIDIKNYDVVVFVQDVSRRRKLPMVWSALTSTRSKYNPKQQWIYATRECVRRITPAFPPSGYTSSVYNMSVTYHSNSTITIPYGHVVARKSFGNEKTNWAQEKEHLVAWMSSAAKKRPHTWRRADLVQHLGQYIDIHSYGRLKQRHCPSTTESCETIMSKYKFYLSFENNCCEEYITEKFWRTLSWDIVPVVIGAPKEHYLRLAPPNSFIYADDFQSAKDLADYLMLLDSNDTLYNSYLEWKEEFEAVNNFPDRPDNVAVTTVPPPNYVYSCQSVCKMAGKFIEEQDRSSQDQSNSSSHFDPLTSWWGGSCNPCGSQPWIRQFS